VSVEPDLAYDASGTQRFRRARFQRQSMKGTTMHPSNRREWPYKVPRPADFTRISRIVFNAAPENRK